MDPLPHVEVDDSIHKATFIGTFSCLALMTIIFNSGFIHTVTRFKGLQTITNKILLSLAVCDLLHGVMIIPLSVLNILPDIIMHPFLCIVVNCVQSAGNITAAAHLLMVTLERYAAIICPLKHRLVISSRHFYWAIAACWFLPLLIGFSPAMGWNYFYAHFNTNVTNATCHIFLAVSCSYFTVYVSLLGTVLAITWSCYIHMFMIASRIFGRLDQGNQTMSQTSTHRSTKATKVIMSTVGYYTLTNLPLACLLLLHCQTYDFPVYVWAVALFLFYSNSAVDPLIYGLGSQSVRKTFLDKVLRRFCLFGNSENSQQQTYIKAFTIPTCQHEVDRTVSHS